MAIVQPGVFWLSSQIYRYSFQYNLIVYILPQSEKHLMYNDV